MYQEQKFELSNVLELSEKQISEHVKLYSGYVKQTNDLVASGIELTRRLAFEFNGMRLHELYFEALSAKPISPDQNSELGKSIAAKFTSFDNWLAEFKKTAATRGPGWALLVHDTKNDTIHNVWISNHEVGHLAGTDIILAVDLWEHAYLVDYLPSERTKYLEVVLQCQDWNGIENRYDRKKR